MIIEYLYRLRECLYAAIAGMEVVLIEYLYRLRACFYDSIAGMEVVIVGGGVNEWIDRNRKERKIMAVRYKLLKTTGSVSKKTEWKAVPVEYRTVGLDDMQRHIERATSQTLADMVGALEAIRSEVIDQLLMGNRVYLPGFGYFSLSIEGERYEDPRSHRFRLRHAAVRGVNFRPEKAFMKALQEAEFENATYDEPATEMPASAKVEAALAELFAEQSFITPHDLRKRLNLSRSGVYRLVAQLEASGKLENAGSAYRKIFVKGKA